MEKNFNQKFAIAVSITLTELVAKFATGVFETSVIFRGLGEDDS
jgi:hypothetical protein